MSSVPIQADRIRGAVLAAAIGDAMGHPTEFMSLERIHQRFGTSGVQKFELLWKRDGKCFAPYTDDTQLAEIVLRHATRTLHEQGTHPQDLDRIMEPLASAFITWHNYPQGGHRGPGGACSSGCRNLEYGQHWSQAGGATAAGCGSVMRAYPWGIVFANVPETAEKLAVEHSKLTHRDPLALAACAAMAIGMCEIMHNNSVNEVVIKMIEAAARYSSGTARFIQGAMQDATNGLPPTVTLDRLRGWNAYEAIAAATYIFLRNADNPRSAILEGANTPGDSDSIATLAGALVGARCGLSALPKEWIEQVERGDELLALADTAIETINKQVW